MAKRAMMGLGRTGGIASTGSRDYILAFSTAKSISISSRNISPEKDRTALSNEEVSH